MIVESYHTSGLMGKPKIADATVQRRELGEAGGSACGNSQGKAPALTSFGTFRAFDIEGAQTMAPLLKLRQAARLIGVSPGKLYRAIADGRLKAAPGGGPGKPTLVSLEVLRTFCQSDGLPVPDEAALIEHAERSGRSTRSERSIMPSAEMLTRETLESLASQYLAQMLAWQSDYIETFVREELSHLVSRVVEQVVAQMAERFTAPQTERTVERSIAMPEASADEDLLSLLKALLPQKRYLRDLGIETLPLARLNARLAPLGYVIDAKKVRDAERFVACTDAYGQVEPFGLFELRSTFLD